MRKKLIIAYPIKVEVHPDQIIIVFSDGVLGLTANKDVLQPLIDKAEGMIKESSSKHLSFEEIKNGKEKVIN